MFSQPLLVFMVLCLSVTINSAPIPEGANITIHGLPSISKESEFHDIERRLKAKPKAKPPTTTKAIVTPPASPKTTKVASVVPVTTSKAVSQPAVTTTENIPSTPATPSQASPSSPVATSSASSVSSAAVLSKSSSASSSSSAASSSAISSSASASSASASSTASTCAIAPAAKRGKIAGAFRSLLSDKGDVHTLNRRVAQAKTGQSITINGFTASLGQQFSGADAGSGDTATFDITWRGGVSAIAKQQTTISTAKFSTEITNTEAASNAQGNGLFIESGCFEGGLWMILQKLNTQDILTQFINTKPSKATCQANLATAATLAAAAQANLATKAGFIQGDENQENYLFDPGFTHVDIIDFGVTTPASAAQATAIQASQLKNFQQVVFSPDLLEIAQGNGACL